MDPLTTISTRRTPQTEQAKPEQVKNAAGGYVFKIGDMAKVRRFLTLGSEGGTYYTGEHALTVDNAKTVLALAASDTIALVNEIVLISDAGRAPKNNPALFALAAAASLGDDEGRRYALKALPKVARIGTHLYDFATYVEQFRGWGRGLRHAVQNWYLDKPVEALAYQMVKYRQRNGWSHRDLLRLSHPKVAADTAHNGLFGYATGKTEPQGALPSLVAAFEAAQVADRTSTWVDLIENHNLSWEMLPDAARAEVQVWQALIHKGMPITALMRQLPTLTRLGALNAPETMSKVLSTLTDPEILKKGRIHPVNVLVALKTYRSGVSLRGDSTWTPKSAVVDALDAGFYAAFGAVEPANKRSLVALDVSGSMGWGVCGGVPLTPREASGALSLVTVATEPSTTVVGFTGGYGPTGLTELPISPRQRMDDVLQTISGLPFGTTDCGLPARWARETGQDFDSILIYTDNETWSGRSHPFQELTKYRQKVGHLVRQVVVGMTATECSIADPSDQDSLDVAGFDSALPNLISSFSRGDA